MAITKLLKVKSAATGNVSSGLRACLRYIANPDKTENLLLIGGSCGGDPDLTFKDMIANKRSWNKPGGTQGYHYILSLSPDEHPDIETMRSLTEDFCKELLQDRNLFAYAIHTDRDHLHSHIVFDSVSHVDGRMWKSGRYDWLARIQPITDRLCKKYGLRSLDFIPDGNHERKGRYHAEWEREKADPLTVRKDVSWADIIRADVDAALAKSRTWPGFLSTLMDMHYDIHDQQHLSLRPEGKGRFVRTGRLGEKYTKSSLMQRLGEACKAEQAFGDAQPILLALRDYMQKHNITEVAGIKAVFYKRWYAYSYVNRSRTPWKYKNTVTELGKYTDRCAYLFRHDITTAEDLNLHINGLTAKKAAINAELRRANNQIYNTPIASWRKLEKLREEMQSASDVDKPRLQKQIANLVASLKDKDIAAEAEKYHRLIEKRSLLQISARKVSADLKLASELAADFESSLLPDDILQDPSRYVPAPFSKQSFHRITVNHSLFADDSEDADMMRVRLPGTREYILLYRADTKIATDSSYASSYIYEHLQYKIVDDRNAELRTIPGQEVMRYFIDRTRERRKSNAR